MHRNVWCDACRESEHDGLKRSCYSLNRSAQDKTGTWDKFPRHQLADLSCWLHWTDGFHGRSQWVGSQLADVFIVSTWWTRRLFDDFRFSERSERMLSDDAFIWLACSRSSVFCEPFSWCCGLQVVCIACDACLWDCHRFQNTSLSSSGCSRPRFGIDKCPLLIQLLWFCSSRLSAFAFLTLRPQPLRFSPSQTSQRLRLLLSVSLLLRLQRSFAATPSGAGSNMRCFMLVCYKIGTCTGNMQTCKGNDSHVASGEPV